MRSISIYFITCIMLLAGSRRAAAQKPEKIYSFVKVSEPVSYYQQQADLWLKEIKKNKKNADAWLNYYQVRRNLQAVACDNHINYANNRTPLDSIVTQMGKYVPNSFEYNFVKWYQGGNDMSLFPYLEKAYKLAPNRPETYPDLTIYYEIKRDTAQRNYFARKMFQDANASPGLLNYNYNVLQGLDHKAILISAGDNDTYPIWMLQAGKGIRQDVTLLNVSLLWIDDYRNKLFDELGIPRVKMDSLATQEDMDKATVHLLKYIAAHSKRPLYLGLTAGSEYAEDIKDSLYLTGLALKYSPERFDNLAVLKKNFEQEYALDYLKLNFGRDISRGIVEATNGNYLVPMLTLYDHYKLSGEDEKAQRLKDLVMLVGEESGQKAELEKYFQNNENR